MTSGETDKARIEAQKSKLDADVAAEGERLSNEGGGCCGDPGSSSDIPKVQVDEDKNDAVATILTDAPTPGIDIRLPSPLRKKATKRSSPGLHYEEPDLKVIIRNDGEEENENENIIDINHEVRHRPPSGNIAECRHGGAHAGQYPRRCSRP